MKIVANTAPHPTNASRGFTLIEVLIAILVLAIGMLGLGAIFPAVIIEQRDAFEVIEGANVASSAQGLISNREFIDFSLIGEDFNRPITGGPSVPGAEPRYSYEWVVPQDGNSNYGWNTPVPGMSDFVTGDWSFDIHNVTTFREITQLPVSARLFPQPYSGKKPKFVWDLALRRSPTGDRLEAAIFVRRIDPRLRVPKDYSFSDVLTGGNGVPGGQKLPVAIDFQTGRVAADDGGPTIVYAAIQTLQVEVHPEHLDWLIFKNGRAEGIDTSVGFAAKIGQKLLDNTGVVRTVVGVPTISPDDSIHSEATGQNRVVLVDPPFVFRNAGGTNTDKVRPTGRSSRLDDPEWDDERASWVRQVIFTPRTPVTIRVVTLEESR